MKSVPSHLPMLLATFRAPSIVKAYHSQFKKWKAWTDKFSEVNFFPANELHIALYLVSLIQSGVSHNVVQKIFYVIFFFYNCCANFNPCNRNFLKSLLVASNRIAPPRVTNRKRPILPHRLHLIAKKFASPGAALSDIRDVCFCLISFAGFLRFDETSNLKWCNINFEDTYFAIFIPRSKTDQFGNGIAKVIARTNKDTCPYNMLLRYADLGKLNTHSDEYVFGNLVAHKNGSYTIRPGSKLSYSRAREVVLTKFRSIGLETKY